MTENRDPHVQKVLQENPAYEAGDVVSLKSGGPSMTIHSIDGNQIRCQWFDKNSLKENTFLKVQLTHTTREQQPIINFLPGDEKL